MKGDSETMKENKGQELVKETQEPTTSHDRAKLNEAIKAVYQRYGTNLPAFFRDAYKERERKHQKSGDNNVEAYPL
jgi:hypothetical protein